MELLTEFWESTKISLPFVGIDFNVLLLTFIGLAVGILGGFFGMGGGWLVAPSLMILGFDPTYAVGTGFGNITASSTAGTLKHSRMGNVDLKLGVCMGVAMIVGLHNGKLLNFRLEAVDPRFLLTIYAAFLATLGSYIVYDHVRSKRLPAKRTDQGQHGEHRAGPLAHLQMPPVIELTSCGMRLSVWPLAGLGVIIGYLAGLLGVGGGVALVPAFIFLVGLPTRIAVGTSLVCVMISGTFGAFTFGIEGRVEVFAVFFMVLGSLVGTQFGAAATKYVRGEGIKLLYAVMLALATAGVVLKIFGLQGWAAVSALGGAAMLCACIVGQMWLKMLRKRASAVPTDSPD